MGGGTSLDSTELLLPSATSWTTSGALPSPRSGLRGATLNNKIVITGTNIDTLIISRRELFYKYDNSLHTMQGVSTGMTAPTPKPPTMTYWSMTSRRENGTRWGPCQSRGTPMPLLSLIITPSSSTVIDDIS